ncbi:hypothetical protein SUDANB148_02971 [Streptomyces sp. SudanB148_2056]|uniref:hypothetical protein n=1 Tax=Streptomyces sp. SudanB148_2056 TaxID=3035280 RepID=UPI003F57F338
MPTKRTEYPDVRTFSPDELLALPPGSLVQRDLGFGQRIVFRRTEDNANGPGKAFQVVGTYLTVGALLDLTGADRDHQENTGTGTDASLSRFETSWPLG